MPQTRYHNRDISGWTQQPSVSDQTYDSIRTYRRNVDPGYARLRISTNTLTGNYSVYLVNDPNSTAGDDISSDDTLIYSYTASSNSQTIGSSSLYSEFFTGGSAYTTQQNALNLGTKQDTLALASSAASSDTAAASNVPSTQLADLQNSTGYRSLSNTGTPPPTDDDQDGTSPTPALASPSNGRTNPLNTAASFSTLGPVGGLMSMGDRDYNRPLRSTATAARGSTYRYPMEIPDLGYDFIKITAYEYVAAGVGGGDLRSASSIGRSSAQRLYNSPLETIILPMQPNLSETNSVDWGGDKLNALQAAGARAAMGTIQGAAGLDAAKLAQTAGAAMNDIKDMVKDEGTKRFLAAYFAGQAVGANVQGRATGQVVNPNLELLFSGPTLRTFSFNFKFTPRSAREAEEIRKIIKTFKRNMAPQRSAEGLFLKTPRIFRLEYIYNDTDEQHPFLNKFKPMALTSFTVNYTPDGSYATYLDNGSVTSYQVDMAFGELEPIYADEIDASWNDMGF